MVFGEEKEVVQGTAVRPSRYFRPTPPELAEDPIVVMDEESGRRTERSRFPDALQRPRPALAMPSPPRAPPFGYGAPFRETAEDKKDP